MVGGLTRLKNIFALLAALVFLNYPACAQQAAPLTGTQYLIERLGRTAADDANTIAKLIDVLAAKDAEIKTLKESPASGK